MSILKGLRLVGAALLCSNLVSAFSPPRKLMSSSRDCQQVDVARAKTLKPKMIPNSPLVLAAELQTVIPERKLNRVQSKMVKILMMAYITSMCVALPVTLFPVYILYRLKIIDRIQKEKLSLKVGQFCSRWLLRVFPFARKKVIVERETFTDPQPSIWVCNHISLLDLFFVLALDKQMRGKNRRPIKILYWKGLEANPVTNLLFNMCGFIPVDMSDNGNGNANEYDPKSFKQMLKSTKNAINDGFDIGILPEGQPNPTPEAGLQPVFSGAFTLAKMSKRPINMMALHGLHKMWHPDNNIGMACTARNMAVRVYPGRIYKSSEEFTETFNAVVGHFGAHGRDLDADDLKLWLDGSFWQTEISRRAGTRMIAEDIDNEELNQASRKVEERTTSP